MTFLRITNLSESMLQTRVESIHVISVAWSAAFISHALQVSVQGDSPLKPAAPRTAPRVTAFQNPTTPISVYANDIDGHHLGLIIGCQAFDSRRIMTAGDKHQVMMRVIDHAQHERQGDQLRSVYVGDSTTDLRCILNADVGICMRDDPMTTEQLELAQALTRLRITVDRLSISSFKDGCTQKTIYFVNTFTELTSALVDA